MSMTSVTVNAGKTITVSDSQGNVRQYVASDTVSIPAADAKKFIDAGLVTAN